ncbi:hypothetical protein Q7C36_012876 [Tachysurus vachellii]|uniref:TNFR-Cys domain-containing protein n=1 Tax=Tachysurus vachellii TaxID=175792 RepID=A0AA88MQY8_TACVA|nr:hypothetical protein Q7C36_012876 [Tachysurus vachellii]
MAGHEVRGGNVNFFFLRRLISTFIMISSLKHTFIITTVFFSNIELYICTCARAEYEINGACCPMCPPGSRVFRYCTENSSTTCKPCFGLTFTDESNSFPRCISCKPCDAGQGLRIKTACTRTSDTVCEPLEGFYCTDEYSVSCRYAVEHTKCSPGQYIKQKGTALKDAECAVCADGTYSNGSLQICKPHSQCEDFGLIEITKGTNSLDAECGKKRPVALIAGVSLVIVVVLAVLLIAIVRMRRKCQLRGKFHINLRMVFNLSCKCFIIKVESLVTILSRIVS